MAACLGDQNRVSGRGAQADLVVGQGISAAEVRLDQPHDEPFSTGRGRAFRVTTGRSGPWQSRASNRPPTTTAVGPVD
jgi:hypothetical protein